MKTTALIGAHLNRWVAKAIGCQESGAGFILAKPVFGQREYARHDWRPSELWSLGGPIIEEEGIALFYDGNGWHAESDAGTYDGETALVAAMRSYVANEFGEDVEDD
jgi:hypothetical protein